MFLIIIVGGLTRLTNSGLSITEWELFKGILPPLNNKSWLFYFNEYKQIPQYKLLNYNMTINEFKIIFSWEYMHRILARIIGLFFLIPLVYFYLSKKIKNEYINRCYLIFGLMVLQGIIGWHMVKSGLVSDITVSHYRLSIHLFTAVIIISSIFWLIKNVISNNNKSFFIISKNNLPFQFFIFLIFIQIVIGGFVSGLDAGKIYQTWPLMGDSFVPNDLTLSSCPNFSKVKCYPGEHKLKIFNKEIVKYFFQMLLLQPYWIEKVNVFYINKIKNKKKILFNLDIVTNFVKNEKNLTNQFVFAHIMSPHPPYILDSNCSLQKFGLEYKLHDQKKFLEQVDCIYLQLETFLKEIKIKMPDTNLFIHSDHGTTLINTKIKYGDENFENFIVVNKSLLCNFESLKEKINLEILKNIMRCV